MFRRDMRNELEKFAKKCSEKHFFRLVRLRAKNEHEKSFHSKSSKLIKFVIREPVTGNAS